MRFKLVTTKLKNNIFIPDFPEIEVHSVNMLKKISDVYMKPILIDFRKMEIEIVNDWRD